ncbi:MAG: 30S ribosomal protein S2 [Vicinamibacteria bacterium]
MVDIKELLEAGVHFGHQTRRWDPKMREYIFGERNGIYIVDLQKTQTMFGEALRYVHDVAASGGTILFVGTKRQAQDVVAEEAVRSNSPFVNERWLGGLLTNFTTVKKSIDRLKQIEMMLAEGRQDRLTKKEFAGLAKEQVKLDKNLKGIRNMKVLPDVIFVVDTKNEAIAVAEARKLRIPVVGIVDTNCNPDFVDYVIPGNDDALRSIRLFASKMADAVIAGRGLRDAKSADMAATARARTAATNAANAANAAAAAAAVAANAAKETPAADVTV